MKNYPDSYKKNEDKMIQKKIGIEELGKEKAMLINELK